MHYPAPYTVPHGAAPAQIAVLHGGPGGAGEVAPLAQALGAQGYGVLEPYQQQTSIAGQVGELHSLVKTNGGLPLCLIGWSWGAWLAIIFAATHPKHVTNLILIGTPPFDTTAAATIAPTRQERLTLDQKRELATLQNQLAEPAALERFLKIYDIADSYARDTSPTPTVHYDGEIHQKIWAEVCRLRENGALLDYVTKLRCPVLAIHGREDPHPVQAVEGSLRENLMSFEFIQLPRCGHKPWQEQYAKAMFYDALHRTLPRGNASHQSEL